MWKSVSKSSRNAWQGSLFQQSDPNLGKPYLIADLSYKPSNDDGYLRLLKSAGKSKQDGLSPRAEETTVRWCIT